MEELTVKLGELHERYRDRQNLVYLKYQTNVHLTSLLVSAN
ncbi:MAG: hypothetical protein QNJ41_20875 [Xenococcaceae cyanobacterium MO_188.B32]|nr:hypothetical protein [Xenococcaceae cyanobacterium MO_188.B32]